LAKANQILNVTALYHWPILASPPQPHYIAWLELFAVTFAMARVFFLPSFGGCF